MDGISERVRLMGDVQAAVTEALSGTLRERGRGFASDREAWTELKECVERTKKMQSDIEKVHKDMVIDYLSGMVSAWVKRELSSRVGVLGIVKKVAYLLAIAVAIVADWVVQTAGAEIGIDFGGFYFFGLLVTIWLVLNECISILENLSEIGVPLPAFLLKLIEKLKKTVENTGENETQ